jgi:hypothetical protein
VRKRQFGKSRPDGLKARGTVEHSSALHGISAVEVLNILFGGAGIASDIETSVFWIALIGLGLRTKHFHMKQYITRIYAD